MLTNEGWTEERTALLRVLWAEGLSCTQIADQIGGLSRNAVIGKSNRLGLPRRKRKEGAPRRPKEKRAYRIGRASVARDLFADALPPPDFLGIPFMQTDSKTCMYPEGDGAHMLFCGQPRKDESSYCPGHHRLCHEVPTGKKTSRWKTWGAAA